MRSLNFQKIILWAGLFLFCLLGLTRDAKAGDIYEDLKWDFTVPLKLKNMLSDIQSVSITVKVYGADGGVLAERGTVVSMLGSGGNLDTAVDLQLDPPAGVNPSLAKKYTVDMIVGHGQPPSFNNPNNIYRAKEGTELVHHIEEQMPQLPAAETGGFAGANAVQ